MKTKKIIFWLIIVAGIVGAIIWFVRSHAPKTIYTTSDVTRGTLTRTVSITGKANPNEQIDLSFKTTGILRSITADVGDSVRKGQILATIDTGTLLSQLRQAQAEVSYQKDTLAHMKNRRSTNTFRQIEAQKAQVRSAQAGVDEILDQLKDINIISPIDGVVIKRNADPGETVVLNLNSPVMSIAQKNDLLIISNVPESDITKLQIGQRAKITFDALSAEDIFNATVSEIDPASTVIQDVVYYRIKLKLDDLDSRFKAGMSTNIDILTAQKDNVLSIPQRAIQTEGEKKYVDILQANNTTQKVYVETGLEGDGGMIEITSGLKGTEKVVTFVETK